MGCYLLGFNGIFFLQIFHIEFIWIHVVIYDLVHGVEPGFILCKQLTKVNLLIQIRLDILSGLIWVQTVYKAHQQATASREGVKNTCVKSRMDNQVQHTSVNMVCTDEQGDSNNEVMICFVIVLNLIYQQIVYSY